MQSRIVIRIVSWPLYRDTYRIVTLLVIHSTNGNCSLINNNTNLINHACILNRVSFDTFWLKILVIKAVLAHLCLYV